MTRLTLILLYVSFLCCPGLIIIPDISLAIEPQSSLSTVQEMWQCARQEMESELKIQGRTLIDLESPKWFEVPYNAIGRLPLIDTCLRSPFLQPEVALWADSQARTASQRFSELLTLAFQLSEQSGQSYPYKAPVVADSDDIPEVFDIEKLDELSLPESVIRPFIGLFQAIVQASRHRDKAFAGLSETEKEQLTVLLPAYFVRKTPHGEMVRGYTSNVDECVDLFDMLTKVDFEALHIAAAIMAEAADNARSLLTSSGFDEQALFKPVLFETDTIIGRVIIGGTAPTTYNADYALILDLGGDDLYLNHPASTALDGNGAAVCIDVSGHDVYRSDGFAQGSALAGVTVFMDLAGDDLYQSGHYSQGAALAGFSFFLDGAGDDTYVGDLGVQCFSIFGYSLFVENNGRDTYRCAANGQAAASTLGVSIMCEAGGDDSYRAGGKYGFYFSWDSSMAQGAASGMRPYPPKDKFTVYGGIGFLSEWSGNDVYHAYNIGQGGSYIFALGMLVDSEGNDTYTCKNYCRGVGVHVGAAVALDIAGDDLYNGLYGNNGYSLDRSSGVFADFSGNDTYRTSGGIGFGHKPKGTGIFLDAAGDDTYAGWENNYGKADWPFGDEAYSTGFFLDYGGHDNYRGELYQNNSHWAEGTFGYGVDVNKETVMTGATAWWSPGQALEMPGRVTATPEIRAAVDRLVAPSALVRMTALNNPVDVLLEAIVLASRSPEQSKRRHLIDTLQYLLTKKSFTEAQAEKLLGLFEAEDHDLRLIGLEMVAKLKVRSSLVLEKVSKLVVDDPSVEVRGMACLALAETDLEKNTPVLLKALTDVEWPVRRRAAIALSKRGSHSAEPALIKTFEEDSAFQVRAYAAEALGKIGLPRLKPYLEQGLQDPDEFVRCLSARALVLSYADKEAMKTIFELLEWKNGPLRGRWVNTFLNMFTGLNLPGTTKDWLEWWNENQNAFDMSVHQRVFTLLQQGEEHYLSSRSDEAIQAYREALVLLPDHNWARNELASLLNGTAWEKAVSGKGLELGREMAQESVLLQPNSENLDTLAVLYYLLDQPELARQTIQQAISNAQPDQTEQYRDRLKEFETGAVIIR